MKLTAALNIACALLMLRLCIFHAAAPLHVGRWRPYARRRRCAVCEPHASTLPEQLNQPEPTPA